jgi:ankyrin repeat protein
MDMFQMIRRTKEKEIIFTAINKDNITVVGKNGETLLHTAIAYNKLDIALELINRKIEVNRQDNDGMSPLHMAAWYHNYNVAKSIIEHNGNPNLRDKHGNNALWYAVIFAKGKYYNLVELLVAAGSDAITNNDSGRSPLNVAKQINDKHLIELLSKEV